MVEGKAINDLDVFEELVESPNVPANFRLALTRVCGSLPKHEKSVCARGFFEGYSFCGELLRELQSPIHRGGK